MNLDRRLGEGQFIISKRKLSRVFCFYITTWYIYCWIGDWMLNRKISSLNKYVTAAWDNGFFLLNSLHTSDNITNMSPETSILARACCDSMQIARVMSKNYQVYLILHHGRTWQVLHQYGGLSLLWCFDFLSFKPIFFCIL